MPAPDKTGSQYKNSEQVILNDSRDDKYGVLAVEIVAENEAGTALLRPQIDADGNLKVTGGSSATSNYAVKIDDTTTDNVTYLGKASIGSITSDAVWQIQKIDESAGTTITWADGDASFDNVWDSFSSLTYS